jgi:hypothetical protein
MPTPAFKNQERCDPHATTGFDRAAFVEAFYQPSRKFGIVETVVIPDVIRPSRECDLCVGSRDLPCWEGACIRWRLVSVRSEKSAIRSMIPSTQHQPLRARLAPRSCSVPLSVAAAADWWRGRHLFLQMLLAGLPEWNLVGPDLIVRCARHGLPSQSLVRAFRDRCRTNEKSRS